MNMATKTISITEEAYNRLVSEKERDESFTNTILKLTGKKDLLRYIRSLKPDEELANSIEEAMTETRKQKLGDVRL
ncbi:MAG: antitoxin VapB family protein [Methanosarcinales archaeon Met12]|nr:MAG: antitoxin VapB family protein [Methanosarcinales archaeon Met12]